MTLFRQMRDVEQGAFTYLLADTATRNAVAIDVCDAGITATLRAVLQESGLRLLYLLETRAHDRAGAVLLATQRATGARIVGSGWGSSKAETRVTHGSVVTFGNEVVRVIATPGHTPGSVCYLWRDRLFTGDCLWIGGCAPCDPLASDAGALFDSVTRRIFSLPDETLIFPARALDGRTVSTVAEERLSHPCFAHRSRDEFVTERRRLATARQPFAGAAASTAHPARPGDTSRPRGGHSP